MKHISIFTLSILFALLAASCSKDFMERYPLDKLSDETYWNTETDLELYTNTMYQSVFTGHGTGFAESPIAFGDNQSDNMVPYNYNQIAAGEHLLPTTGGGWDWAFIRRCNFFLTRYQRTPIAENIRNIYAGEVLLFRSIEYWEKVKRFGNVPFFTHDLQTNSPELFEPATDRSVVMDSVLVDLNKAIEYLPAKGNEAANRVNKDVALAFKARICLHEGTFRKYHGLADSEKYFTEAANAAKTLIDGGKYQLSSTGNPAMDYRNVFNRYDQTSNKEVIFFRKYDFDLGIGTNTSRFIDLNERAFSVSKSLVDEYLCTDGFPIGLSGVYQGDNSILDEIRNRDPRLLQTVVEPNTNMLAGVGFAPIPGSPSTGQGIVATGYMLLKHWVNDPQETFRADKGILDAIIIRYGEVLLIYAEAKAELGQADQGALDISINKLRDRVNMPHLSEAVGYEDPVLAGRFPGISNLLREIRRERRVELACEGFRYDDLIRWKAGKVLEERVIGAKFNVADYPTVEVGADIFLTDDGYIDVYHLSLPNGRTFEEPKHYLFPIPQEELILNPELDQNPGWE